MHHERKINELSNIQPFTPYLSLSPHSQTDRQTDRQKNEYTCCRWAGGTEIQFVAEKNSYVIHRILLRSLILELKFYKLCMF